MSFIERHGLWDGRARERAAEIAREIERDGIELVRFSFPDLHGILRGKALTPLALGSAFRDGISITSSLLMKDTSHRTAVPIFTAGAGIGDARIQGAGDVVMVPDPWTYRRLPWAPNTAMMLCDLYYADGEAMPLATRHFARGMHQQLAANGRHLICGLEVEFHLFRLEDARLGMQDGGQPGTPPEVSLLHQGYNYLTDQRFDLMSPIVDIIRRDLLALGLPLTSVEIEFGPSQCEFVFAAVDGFQAADDMVVLRSAVKQIARRHGYHATFMCRPSFPNAMSSGWHLHQSIRAADGTNLFAAADGTGLSEFGLQYLAGLLAHAGEASVLSAPTINAYKRYRQNSLAPDRIAWGRDNRGAMLRVIDKLSASATRIENRAGEPAANPYLYIFSQVACGFDGVDRAMIPPAPVDNPYEDHSTRLPSTLDAALNGFASSVFLRSVLGNALVDHIYTIKSYEVARFNEHVTDWEHREYFEVM